MTETEFKKKIEEITGVTLDFLQREHIKELIKKKFGSSFDCSL